MTHGVTNVNLDLMAARYAQEIIRRTRSDKNGNVVKASAVDNIVTKAFGVLQENGVYASALFLKSRRGDEKEQADVLMEEILNLLENIGKELNFDWGARPDDANNVDDVLKYLSDNVTVDLERLLLAKETLEQMLIYARYGAKARSAEEGST